VAHLEHRACSIDASIEEREDHDCTIAEVPGRAFKLTLGGVIGALVIAAGVLAVRAWTAVPRPAPPPPPDLGNLDPALADRIRRELSAVEERPNEPSRRVRLAMVYAANALPEQARMTLEQVVDRGHGDERAWYHLAHALAEVGDLEAALAAVDRSVDAAAGYAPARAQRGLWLLDVGRVDEAEVAFRAALETDDSSRAGRLGLARALLQRGDDEAAAALLQSFVSADDDYARQLLATAYRRMDRLEEAEALLRGVDSTAPTWDDPWRAELNEYRVGYRAELDRAKRHAMRGDFAGAVTILDRLRRHRDATVEVYNNLGMSYLALQRHDDAIGVMNEGVRLNPNSHQAQHLLAGAYWTSLDRLPERDRPAALQRVMQHVERALEIKPTSVPSLTLRADALVAMQRHQQAIEAYQLAARWAPEDPDPLLRAGTLHLQLRNWSDAVSLLEQAAGRGPPTPTLLGRLAMAYAAAGRSAAADAVLADAERRFPRSPEVSGARQEIERLRGQRP
jgi:tetratricopeptide (TPR) repeat protein